MKLGRTLDLSRNKYRILDHPILSNVRIRSNRNAPCNCTSEAAPRKRHWSDWRAKVDRALRDSQLEGRRVQVEL